VNDNNTLADDLRERIRDLEAQLERSRSTNVYDGNAHKRVADLEAALRKYGMHKRELGDCWPKCECGLEAILGAASETPPHLRGPIIQAHADTNGVPPAETPAEQQERALVTCKHDGTKTRDPYGTYWCDICKGILTDSTANRGSRAKC